MYRVRLNNSVLRVTDEINESLAWSCICDEKISENAVIL